MKIGFLLTEFPSLSETFILNQITGLIDKEEEVFVFSKRPGNFKKLQPEIEKYNLLEKTYFANIPENKAFLLFKFLAFSPKVLFKNPKLFNTFKLKEISKREKFELFFRGFSFLGKDIDVLISCFGPNGRDAVFLKRMGVINSKIIVSFFGYDLTKIFKQFNPKAYYKEVLKEADLLLPICEFFKKKLLDIGADNKKIKVHHIGIDMDGFKFEKRKRAKKLKILTVSRLVSKKGIEYAIKALASLKDRIDFEYKIIGEGPEKERLKSLVSKLGFEKRIEFLGAKDSIEVKKLLKKADVFLLPSITSRNGDMEGTPISLMEAMASGVFVITSCHSGISEFVKHKKTGWLAEEKNIFQIAQGVDFFVKNEILVSRILKNARSEICKNFNIKKLNNSLYKYIRNV
ncbi:glycosyltransferase [Patescibacteria group bacterium]|nr:glycosyltransferase [Patescibacteria group bacterium]